MGSGNGLQWQWCLVSGVPKLDPDWRRRRPPPEEPSNQWFAVIVAIVVVAVLWVARERAQARDAVLAAQGAAQAQAAAVVERRPVEVEFRPAQPQSVAAPARAMAGGYDTPRWEERARQDGIAEQERVRRNAEAKLAYEMQRFAALSNQNGYSSPYSQPSNSNQSRCAQAKADRDQAMRLVGNNRTFDFIRQWDDIVFEACKRT